MMCFNRRLVTAAAISACLLCLLHASTASADEKLGPEIIINGSMEQDGAWQGIALGSATAPKLTERTDREKHGGRWSTHVVIERTLYEYPRLRSTAFKTEAGKTYKVSMWMKATHGAAKAVWMNDVAGWHYFYQPSASFTSPSWREYTTYYTERATSNTTYLDIMAVGEKTEFYLDDVSIREVDQSVRTVQSQWENAFPGRSYICWQKSPWDNTLKQVQWPPDRVKECSGIGAAMGKSEYESASFVVTNFSGKDMAFDVRAVSPSIGVTLREAVWVDAYSGNKVNDALPLLDGKLSIPSGESREVWITLRTQDQAPGVYKGRIEVQPDGGAVQSIPVSVKVYPVTLPDPLPLHVYYWDFIVPTWSGPELTKAWADDLKAHYVNTGIAHPYIMPKLATDANGKLQPLDFELLDKTLDVYDGMNVKMVVFHWVAQGYLENIENPKFMTPEWKEVFADWLTQWVAHLKQRGYGYDRFAVYPYDEILTAKVYNMARLIKRIDPNIKFFVNCPGFKTEEPTAIAPYVDIYCPMLYSHLGWANFEETWAARELAAKTLNKNREFFWTYANNPDWQPEESSPYSFYRLAAWRAWNEGMGGFGYWIYSYSGRWNSYKVDAIEPNFPVVYDSSLPDAPQGMTRKERVVTGKRWEATREGVEDIAYLEMLRRAVESPGASSSAERSGRELLEKLPAKLIARPDDSGPVDAAKEAVLRALSKLGAH